jgi:hypothetical protein
MLGSLLDEEERHVKAKIRLQAITPFGRAP